MKILFISSFLAGGGASKLISDLLPLLKKDGIVCELLVLSEKNTKYKDVLRDEGIKVEFIPDAIVGHWKRMKYIDSYVRKGNYDLIHVHLFPAIYYCAIIKKFDRRVKTPIIMTEHSTDNRRRHVKWLRPVEKSIYKNYQRVISISRPCQEALLDWLEPSYKEEKSFQVVTNGIFVEKYNNAAPYHKYELHPGLKDEDIVIGMVGSFTIQKNHKAAIHLIEELDSRYKIVFAGEGALEQEVRDLVRQKSLENRVFFLGFRRDIPNILKSVDIVIIPSKWEGFGLIAVEAMACGKSIVASGVPGLSEVVGDAGLLVDTENAQEFAKAVTDFENQQLASTLQEIALERSKMFNISETAKEYERIYIQIVE